MLDIQQNGKTVSHVKFPMNYQLSVNYRFLHALDSAHRDLFIFRIEETGKTRELAHRISPIKPCLSRWISTACERELRCTSSARKKENRCAGGEIRRCIELHRLRIVKYEFDTSKQTHIDPDQRCITTILVHCGTITPERLLPHLLSNEREFCCR